MAENLRSGVLLDIAGGRGDLAFELSFKFGLRCVIIDPRPQKFRRWQLKLMRRSPDTAAPTHVQD